jgi:hypothetical protein
MIGLSSYSIILKLAKIFASPALCQDFLPAVNLSCLFLKLTALQNGEGVKVAGRPRHEQERLESD